MRHPALNRYIFTSHTHFLSLFLVSFPSAMDFLILPSECTKPSDWTCCVTLRRWWAERFRHSLCFRCSATRTVVPTSNSSVTSGATGCRSRRCKRFLLASNHCSGTRRRLNKTLPFLMEVGSPSGALFWLTSLRKPKERTKYVQACCLRNKIFEGKNLFSRWSNAFKQLCS